jgi:hypothetical protein
MTAGDHAVSYHSTDMSHITAIIVLGALALAAARGALAAEPTTRPTVLVELFTSEGCSSCPPADDLLAELAKGEGTPDVRIIPLALHVDYWNRQGWADPFSSAKFTQRQEDYARALHVEQIYTPQMVVDGTAQLVGSDREAAKRAIASSSAGAKKATLSIEPTVSADGKTLTCKLVLKDLAADLRGAADLRLAVTEDDLASEVRRGENAGRTLRHIGVARTLVLVARLDLPHDRAYSGGTRIDVAAPWKKEHLNAVAFVQSRETHAILAAGSAPLGAAR